MGDSVFSVPWYHDGQTGTCLILDAVWPSQPSQVGSREQFDRFPSFVQLADDFHVQHVSFEEVPLTRPRIIFHASTCCSPVFFANARRLVDFGTSCVLYTSSA